MIIGDRTIVLLISTWRTKRATQPSAMTVVPSFP
jgi:hypothetical protein